MTHLFIKHFGKINACIYLILSIFIQHLAWKISIFSYSTTLLIYSLVMSVVLFVLMYRKKCIYLCKILFLSILWSFHFGIFTTFEKSIRQDFENENISMMEMKASLSLGSLILTFALFIAFLVMGSIFDNLAKKNKT
ncbi:hypothetical protein [Capnocytophaga catalasegens]|nr:hypothetical protein [Capnocytophaga catalasegens]